MHEGVSDDKNATAKALIYLAALISFTLSVYLWFGASREQGLFVGMWVPSILALGALLFANRSGIHE